MLLLFIINLSKNLYDHLRSEINKLEQETQFESKLKAAETDFFFFWTTGISLSCVGVCVIYTAEQILWSI